MEKKYIYVYTTDDEFIPAVQLIHTIENGEEKFLITTEDGHVQDVTGKICVAACLTKEKAALSYELHQTTGLWPFELSGLNEN